MSGRNDHNNDFEESPYENGYWEWDKTHNALEFKKAIPDEEEDRFLLEPAKIAGSVQFIDEIEVLEQLKFRRLFQRPFTEESDVVTLQDVKDVSIFTAPRGILNKAIVNVLHLPHTDRFLRALIFYCQYLLQVSDDMNRRNLELRTKVATEKGVAIEAEYQENLEDLRVLIAKEYSTIILGGDGFDKYHHMGKFKLMSLTRKDSLFFETIIRMSTQIVWIALGRLSKQEVEVEINRLLKSDRFNFVMHKKNYQRRFTSNERSVTLGHCLNIQKTLKTVSPLINDVLCNRSIDPRLFGIGQLKYRHLSSRLAYFELIMTAPEKLLQVKGITIGIIGMGRKHFDTMLKNMKDRKDSRSTQSFSVGQITKSRASTGSTGAFGKIYPDINIPEKESHVNLLHEFPTELVDTKGYDSVQHNKWLSYVAKRRNLTFRPHNYRKIKKNVP